MVNAIEREGEIYEHHNGAESIVEIPVDVVGNLGERGRCAVSFPVT